MEKLYDDKFIEEIKKQIIEGKYNTKEDLIRYLDKLSVINSNDNELQAKVSNGELDINLNDFDDIKQSLGKYYDLSKEDLASLNIENVSEVTLENNKKFAKVKDELGNVSYIDINNAKSDSLVDVLKSQDSINAIESGIENSDTIVKDLKDSNRVIEVGSIDEKIKYDNLDEDRKKEVAAILNTDVYRDSNGFGTPDSVQVADIVGSPEDNIYYDKKKDKTFYVDRVFNGYEVKETNKPGTSSNVSEEVVENVDLSSDVNTNTTDSVGLTVTDAILADLSINNEEYEEKLKKVEGYDVFNQMSVNELECALKDHGAELTDDQKQLVEHLMEAKIEEEAKEEELSQEHEKEGKQLVLTYNNNNNTNNETDSNENGFTSLVFLYLMVLINGLLVMGYIFFSVIFGK